MIGLDPTRRRDLRAALLARYPWIDHDDVGPRAVEAGECDRCDREARMVTTCGPSPWQALGRVCAGAIGDQAWCDGHADQGRVWLDALAALPPEADTVARLWWVATGEVRVDSAGLRTLLQIALPDATAARSQRVDGEGST